MFSEAHVMHLLLQVFMLLLHDLCGKSICIHTQPWLRILKWLPAAQCWIFGREACAVFKKRSTLAKAVAAATTKGVDMGQIITSTTGAIQDAEKVSQSSLQQHRQSRAEQRRQARAAGRQVVRMTWIRRTSSLAHLLGLQP